ncbi:hypothetical protein Agub_g4573, partial [Astrephomene gubernaculifera]
MECPCPTRWASNRTWTCFPHERLLANFRPNKGFAHAIRRRLACQGSHSNGSYDVGLTRSQEGRRQRARRKAPSDVAPSTSSPSPWSPSEIASSRMEWLHGAKEQPSEVLLSALLAPQQLPPQRLPVLLALLEGRPDLPACLRAAAGGLGAVAAAVTRSELLQRLLPGGRLH